MKDETKRIKCFGCEHISYHFLLLPAASTPVPGMRKYLGTNVEGKRGRKKKFKKK